MTRKASKAVSDFMLNARLLLSTAFNIIPQRYNSKVNPVTGRKVITNIPTQTLADNPHSFEVTYLLPDGKRRIIKRESFIPARDSTGKYVRGMAGDTMKGYRTGLQKNTDKECEHEFYSLLSFFIVCILRGKLPSPEKRSGASTIRSSFVDYWLNETGLKVESIKMLGEEGKSITYQPEHFENVMTIFRYNAEDIFNNWQDTVRGGDSDFKVTI